MKFGFLATIFLVALAANAFAFQQQVNLTISNNSITFAQGNFNWTYNGSSSTPNFQIVNFENGINITQVNLSLNNCSMINGSVNMNLSATFTTNAVADVDYGRIRENTVCQGYNLSCPATTCPAVSCPACPAVDLTPVTAALDSNYVKIEAKMQEINQSVTTAAANSGGFKFKTEYLLYALGAVVAAYVTRNKWLPIVKGEKGTLIVPEPKMDGKGENPR